MRNLLLGVGLGLVLGTAVGAGADSFLWGTPQGGYYQHQVQPPPPTSWQAPQVQPVPAPSTWGAPSPC